MVILYCYAFDFFLGNLKDFDDFFWGADNEIKENRAYLERITLVWFVDLMHSFSFRSKAMGYESGALGFDTGGQGECLLREIQPRK